jgi:eukaryotic-like serine/threonine-protein kinase
MSALLGGYQLIRRIAVGGMAEVFLARRLGPRGPASAERRVALKRILPHLGREPAFIARFLDEARLAARLHHPHVVRLYELGLDGSDYFLAMEHVAGQDVQAILRRADELGAPVAFADAAALLADACEALEHAHGRGVIHRDVTPSNLLLSYDGVVKLVDFGIAQAVVRGRAGARPGGGRGALEGKVGYMSPEQASGGAIDRRADLFSLGVCGWELLAGRRRLAGGTGRATLERARAGEVAPLSSARAEVPAALEATLARALEREPARRWPTARAFGGALREWLRSTGAAPSRARLAAYMTRLFGADAALCARAIAMPQEPTARV